MIGIDVFHDGDKARVRVVVARNIINYGVGGCG